MSRTFVPYREKVSTASVLPRKKALMGPCVWNDRHLGRGCAYGGSACGPALRAPNVPPDTRGLDARGRLQVLVGGKEKSCSPGDTGPDPGRSLHAEDDDKFEKVRAANADQVSMTTAGA